MPVLQVDSVAFVFRPSMAVQKYDEWHHYIAVWNASGRKKAVDRVAMRMTSFPPCKWLIEVKDFRVVRGHPDDSNLAGLAQTVADKGGR